MKNTELHLIVLWENARHKEKEILSDIKNNVKIREIYEISWSKKNVLSNFSRFYGVKHFDVSFKEKECGSGAFLCVVVEDENPCYDFVKTSRGHEFVNTTLFSLKQKYRSWVGGSRIHSTNSVKETNHDSALLLGINYTDLQNQLPVCYDGNFKKKTADITGTDGWKDLSELFYTLNATLDYVVLRGFEDIEQTIQSKEHGDVDVLVKEYLNAKLIINGKEWGNKSRPHYSVSVKNSTLVIDLWDIKNNYHTSEWDQEILSSRHLYKNMIFVPADENYFYILIYHTLIHKQKIATDYYDKIYTLFKKLGLDKSYNIAEYASPFDLYWQLLVQFMDEKKYYFIKPNDDSVFYSQKLTDLTSTVQFLKTKYFLKNITPVYTNLINSAYNTFLCAESNEGNKLFIKCGNNQKLYKNEYEAADELYQLDSKHFSKPILYRDYSDLCFIAFPFEPGISLKDLMQQKPSIDCKKSLVDDLKDIFSALKKSHIIHRDIRPENFLYIDNVLKLIDFQLAASKKYRKDMEFLDKNNFACGLGCEYAVAPGIWDDAYSLLKVLEFIGDADEYHDEYEKLHRDILSEVGKNRIRYSSPQKMILFKLIWYKIRSVFSLSRNKRTKYRIKYRNLITGFHL